MLRGHLYPSTIKQLFWSENLVLRAPELEAVRRTFFASCLRRFGAGAELTREASALGLQPLAAVFRQLTREMRAALMWSDEFDGGEDFILEAEAPEPLDEGEGYCIRLSTEGHSLTVPSEAIAQLISAGLMLAENTERTTEITKARLLALPIPPTAEAAEELACLIERFKPWALEDDVESEVDKIDEIVGEALGLSTDDVLFIQQEMSEDPFLSRIKPGTHISRPRNGDVGVRSNQPLVTAGRRLESCVPETNRSTAKGRDKAELWCLPCRQAMNGSAPPRRAETKLW